MVAKTMRMNKIIFLNFIFLIFFNFFCFCDDWIVAAQSFEINDNKDYVKNSLCDFFPSAILENLGSSLNRNVVPDEKYARAEYNYQNEILSLFLQISSEYKKRDALILQNYSERELKKNLKSENEKINELEQKLEEKLEERDKAKFEAEKNMQLVQEGNYERVDFSSEGKKWLYLFKNFFVDDKTLVEQETISFYKNDVTSLFKPSETALKNGIESYDFQKEINSAKINTLITGKIALYGDFLSVTVNAYLFPSAKKIVSVMEVGRMEDTETIAASLARKLVPYLTNAFPVEIELFVSPQTDYKFYLDDVLQHQIENKFMIDSGTHTIQILADGFSPATTTFRFEGNRRYKIEVNLKEMQNAFVYLMQKNPSDLEVFASGEKVQTVNNQYSKIKINGNSVLGMFSTPDDFSSFFYIPKEVVLSEEVVKMNPKIKKDKDYIDKRRRIMYASYSALIISLIPNFVCQGEFQNYNGVYEILKTEEAYNSAIKWGTASNICTGISIGCGVFFAYELVRYLISANSILPKKAKKTGIDLDFINFEDLEKSSSENISENEEIENLE